MRERLEDMRAFQAEVIVVTFTRSRNLSGYRRRFAEPLRVMSDEQLTLYRSLGFGRGSIRRVWGWRAALKYGELIRGGARPQRSAEDTLQLGGDVIIDADGRLAWIYAGAGPDDRPEVDEIVEQLSRLRSL